MVTCNLCGQNKPVEEIEAPFSYVCKECWRDNRLQVVVLDGKKPLGEDTTIVSKDNIY